MIKVTNLSLDYPASGISVLQNVNFSAGRGERIALIGANGAGKSTLLLSLVGVVPPSAGGVEINGIPVLPKNYPEVRRLAGLVFQNPDDQLFMPTLWEDVLFGPRNWAFSKQKHKARMPIDAGSMANIEEKCLRQLEALGISALKDRLSHKLSGGEKRLGALASVLVMEPAVLLLDEPTAFLDPKSRRRLIAILRELTCTDGSPQTMLVATHDLDFARALCGRAILLSGKTVHTCGPASAILDDGALLESCGL